MSFYFRDKPRFGERLRGKSGDELLQELKQQLDQDSNVFFEPVPQSRAGRERDSFERQAGFPRGFPFDDEGFGRRTDIRSHLDDLASRHPEFAEHLLGPAWGETPFHGTLRNRRRGSGTGSSQGQPDDDARSQASGSSAASAASGASGVSSLGDPDCPLPDHLESRRRPIPKYDIRNIVEPEAPEPADSRSKPIPQYGLRNTVDIGQHRHNLENPDKMNRGQRSMSAPPENRQPQSHQQAPPQQQSPTPNQRFVSRVDITPQQQSPPPPAHPQKPQQRAPQQSNVRHIPIFVEGRDEPVVPKNVDEPVFTPQQQSPPQFQRPSHFNQHYANRQQQWPPHFQEPFYEQAQQQPRRTQQQQQQAAPAQQPNHYQQQQQQYRQQQAEKQRAQAQQEEEETEAPKLKQIQPKDPLERVALVQKEVDLLAEQVKKYTGSSRKDKDYMYLDEMLTRELIKLDDIETEGKEVIRQARKDTIKSIQNCISLLESKAPLPGQQTDAVEEERKPESMETETGVQAVAGEPIPLPAAPSSPSSAEREDSAAGNTTDETVQLENQQKQASTERSSSAAEEPMSTESAPLAKVASVTAMEVQQDAEHAKTQQEVEPTKSAGEPGAGAEEKQDAQEMEVEKQKAPKSPKKGRKTKKQTPVSQEPIPLPAPETVN